MGFLYLFYFLLCFLWWRRISKSLMNCCLRHLPTASSRSDLQSKHTLEFNIERFLDSSGPSVPEWKYSHRKEVHLGYILPLVQFLTSFLLFKMKQAFEAPLLYFMTSIHAYWIEYLLEAIPWSFRHDLSILTGQRLSNYHDSTKECLDNLHFTWKYPYICPVAMNYN